MAKLGELFPNFKATTTEGLLDFYEWLGNSWGILFSHPADFTPVCTTELARVVNLFSEFEQRNTKVIALSCDSIKNHKGWIPDILTYSGDAQKEFPFPIIADEDRHLAVELGILDKDEIDKEGLPLTARSVFIIGPNKKLRLMILYPAIIGRNFDEIIRVLDALQLTDKHDISTPVDWKSGNPVMVLPTVAEEDIKEKFSGGVRTCDLPSGKNYMRMTLDPY